MINKQKLREIVNSIHQEIRESSQISPVTSQVSSSEKIKKIINKHLAQLNDKTQKRLNEEFFSHGPLISLLDDESIKEILINGDQEIWVDRHGPLEKQVDTFLSPETFHRWTLMFYDQAQIQATLSTPFADGKWKNFRVHLITPPVTQKGPVISLRRHPKTPWTIGKLKEEYWSSKEKAYSIINKIIQEKKNFLIVGSTSSGKTSVLNAFLQGMPSTERCLLLEDTAELVVPNLSSIRLVTRFDANGLLKDIPLSTLVKQSLRMRPDRLIIGEIRGPEAKDLLLAMATGHRGCAGTLHARNTQEAITRLEMLIQLGAPQWNLLSVRTLIQSTIDFVLVVEKKENGQRRLKEITQLISVEKFGITLEKII